MFSLTEQSPPMQLLNLKYAQEKALLAGGKDNLGYPLHMMSADRQGLMKLFTNGDSDNLLKKTEKPDSKQPNENEVEGKKDVK